MDVPDISATKKPVAVQSHESRTFSAFPPPSNHPSLTLSLSPHSNHSTAQRPRRSPAVSARPTSALPLDASLSSRGSTPANVTPYRNTIGPLPRPRRTRPEPYQLDALKDLFTRTSNPSIEERSALALEIGMCVTLPHSDLFTSLIALFGSRDLGKVTNWFRNLRQTARKRAKKGADDDDDDDSNVHSSPPSRSGTPSFRSSSSSPTNDQDDQMDLDDAHSAPTGHNHGGLSDMGSDDEYQEAVTPSPEPSPPPPAHPPIPSAVPIRLHPVVNPVSYPELDKASAARFSGIKLDDALLLLSFHHQHIAH
jgi:Homeodomain